MTAKLDTCSPLRCIARERRPYPIDVSLSPENELPSHVEYASARLRCSLSNAVCCSIKIASSLGAQDVILTTAYLMSLVGLNSSFCRSLGLTAATLGQGPPQQRRLLVA